MLVNSALKRASLEVFTTATLPTASSFPNRIIFNSDTKQELVSDGTNWIPTGSKIVSPNGLTTTTLGRPNGGANYSLTLPNDVPPAVALLQMTTAGQVEYATALAPLPTGAILPYGGAAAPSGYLLCNGAAVSRTTYAALFAAIGEAYGEGDNSTTFNLPDARGRFLRGVDGGAGHDPDASSRTASATGGNTGDNVGSLQADQVGPHTHTFDVWSGGLAFQTKNGGTDGAGVTANPSTAVNSGSESRPKNIYVNYIIKT